MKHTVSSMHPAPARVTSTFRAAVVAVTATRLVVIRRPRAEVFLKEIKELRLSFLIHRHDLVRLSRLRDSCGISPRFASWRWNIKGNARAWDGSHARRVVNFNRSIQ